MKEALPEVVEAVEAFEFWTLPLRCDGFDPWVRWCSLDKWHRQEFITLNCD